MSRSLGLTLLSLFFVFGALMASLAAVGLLYPNGVLEPMWRLNPNAQIELMRLRGWGTALMLVVATVCAVAAIGVWNRTWWGYRFALIIITGNLLSDLLNAVVRGDLRTLIGVPIGGAVIYYLLKSRTRAQFEVRDFARQEHQ